jgi:predicted ATP-dependent endonuclease of OLD family
LSPLSPPDNKRKPKGDGMTKIVATDFRVQNFRNIEDSGWIPIERVTALVGRNESGKTALLKALHKFNPASPEPYDPQREFPRDRLKRDFKDGDEWPVCSVRFSIGSDMIKTVTEKTPYVPPITSATVTRYYSGNYKIEYEPEIPADFLAPTAIISELDALADNARKIAAPAPEQEETTKNERSALLNWVDTAKTSLNEFSNLRDKNGPQLLTTLKTELNGKTSPITADVIKPLAAKLDNIIEQAQRKASNKVWNEAILGSLPVFIYFENYGILDSAVYLPEFVEKNKSEPNNPRVRTISAMFKHVNLTGEEIQTLGEDPTERARIKGEAVSAAMIDAEKRKKEERAITLNAASLDITKRFSNWWKQRRHQIRYHADGQYFRIWVADDRRPGVEIELESRSKGFQWFFSFYLVFLVESEEGHKDAVLLLDEPGLDLHPTAQQELIAFFESLSVTNQLLYTTHSPFLIDGEHLERVRCVVEGENGISRVSIGEWPKDRETIFPLQAAAGYAMVKALFRYRKNVLVEGLADYLYLNSLSLLCKAAKRVGLPHDIYITPCGGAKYVGHLAALFLGQKDRPLVLLDADDAGRARKDALLKNLYASEHGMVVTLDQILGKQNCEIEDLIGEDLFLPAASQVLGRKISLSGTDAALSLPDRVKAVATRDSFELPDGWKSDAARQVAVTLSLTPPEKAFEGVIERAEALFKEVVARFP